MSPSNHVMKSSITFTVPGKPVPQGSMTHVGNGHMVHKPELIAWRRKVAQVALIHAKQAGWELPLDEPVQVGVTFYLPAPKHPRWPMPAVKPDLDKLQRAIGDALSPNQGPRVLAEDSRIYKWLDPEKTYAKPGQECAVIEIVRLA